MSIMDGRAFARIVGAGLTALVVSVSGGHEPLSAQEGRECHCVDGDGERIENCTCFQVATPEMSGMALNMAFPGMPRVRIGVSIEGTRPDADVAGVLIRRVEEGSPAAEGRLEPGDVVTHLAGRSLLDPLADADEEAEVGEGPGAAVDRFMALVRELEPGETVEIDYSRNGEERTAVVVPEARGLFSLLNRYGAEGFRPGGAVRFNFEEGDSTSGDLPRPMHFFRFENREGDEEGHDARSGTFRLRSGSPGLVSIFGNVASPCFDGDERRDLFVVVGGGCVDGLWLEALNPQLAEYFDVTGGVLVTKVAEDASLDVKAGDVIVAVGNREVEDPADVRRILGSYEIDEAVTLTVVRKGERMEVRGTRR